MPDAKAKAEALLASLPESIRAKYGSAEKMMAMMQMNTKPIVAARVLSQDEGMQIMLSYKHNGNMPTDRSGKMTGLCIATMTVGGSLSLKVSWTSWERA